MQICIYYDFRHDRSTFLCNQIFHFSEVERFVRLWLSFNQGKFECWNRAFLSRTKVTSYLWISCKSGPATAETRRGTRAHLRKACKNHDWFTSPLPGLQHSSTNPSSTVQLWVLQRTKEGWVMRVENHRGGAERKRPRENGSVEKK